MGRKSDPVLRQSLSGTVAMVGAYSSSVSEAAQISDGGRTTTAPLLRHAESPRGPCPHCKAALQWGRGSRGWGQRSAVLDKGDLHPRIHLREGTSACTLNLCLWLTQAENLQGPHLLQHYPRRGKGPGAGRGENTQFKGTEPAWASDRTLIGW